MSTVTAAVDFIKNANDAFVLILDISENFPIIGQVASICKTIYEKADTASSNKDNCKKAAKRCRAIQIIIAQCAKDFKRAPCEMSPFFNPLVFPTAKNFDDTVG